MFGTLYPLPKQFQQPKTLGSHKLFSQNNILQTMDNANIFNNKKYRSFLLESTTKNNNTLSQHSLLDPSAGLTPPKFGLKHLIVNASFY